MSERSGDNWTPRSDGEYDYQHGRHHRRDGFFSGWFSSNERLRCEVEMLRNHILDVEHKLTAHEMRTQRDVTEKIHISEDNTASKYYQLADKCDRAMTEINKLKSSQEEVRVDLTFVKDCIEKRNMTQRRSEGLQNIATTPETTIGKKNAVSTNKTVSQMQEIQLQKAQLTDEVQALRRDMRIQKTDAIKFQEILEGLKVDKRPSDKSLEIARYQNQLQNVDKQCREVISTTERFKERQKEDREAIIFMKSKIEALEKTHKNEMSVIQERLQKMSQGTGLMKEIQEEVEKIRYSHKHDLKHILTTLNTKMEVLNTTHTSNMERKADELYAQMRALKDEVTQMKLDIRLKEVKSSYNRDDGRQAREQPTFAKESSGMQRDSHQKRMFDINIAITSGKNSGTYIVKMPKGKPLTLAKLMGEFAGLASLKDDNGRDVQSWEELKAMGYHLYWEDNMPDVDIMEIKQDHELQQVLNEVEGDQPVTFQLIRSTYG